MTDVSNEYSQALFMLAAEHGKEDEFEKELSEIRSLLQENPEYLQLLSSPGIPIKERLDTVDKAFGDSYSEYIVCFIKLMCENGRISELIRCIDEFQSLKRFSSNVAAVTVYSAVELSPKQKERLCGKLAKSLSKTIVAEYKTDKSLLGGIKVEVDGKIFDGSVRNHLKRIKGVMNG